MISSIIWLSLSLVLGSSQNATTTTTTTSIKKGNELKWKDINISLPQNTSHQVIGYYGDEDRVYLMGGKGVQNEYWTIQFNQSYNGWNENEKYKFEDLKIIEYQQSYFTSKHNIIYLKTGQYIHIYDMEIDYFNLNVIELPIHIKDGCMTVYYEPKNDDIEYLIIIGSKTETKAKDPTTWIYKVDKRTHNITFFDIGPDLIGIRKNFCCTVMDEYLYVIGGIYDDEDTRFIEQWLIDIDTDYGPDSTSTFDNFTNINTLMATDIAENNLPQFGHRCIINNLKKHIYIIGGITEEFGEQNDAHFNYSKYILVLRREDHSLHEINYLETKDEETGHLNITPQLLPSLPTEMAYTSAMMDQYGYLNLFGGELNSESPTNKWFRINTKYNGIYDVDIANDDEIDVIWKNHKKHNHNEQWALLILLIMILVVGVWFKCISRISKLRGGNRRRNGRGINSDGTAYDEITATSDVDDMEQFQPEDIDDDNVMYNGPSSDENQYLNGIISNVDDDIDDDQDDNETEVAV